MADAKVYAEPAKNITGKATAGITGGRLVKVSATKPTDGPTPVATAGAGEVVFGVAGHDAAIGDKVTVEISKPIDLIPCAAAVARGAKVEAAAAGKVQTATTGQVLGLALNTTTAADQLVYVLRF